MRCILLFCSLIGLTFAVSCWSDSSDNEKHTKEKKVMDCGSDCNYCAKGTGKFKAGMTNDQTSVSLWSCGCGSAISNLTGVECKDKGSQSVSNAYVDGTLYCCKGKKAENRFLFTPRDGTNEIGVVVTRFSESITQHNREIFIEKLTRMIKKCNVVELSGEGKNDETLKEICRLAEVGSIK
ncbi:unnamed protein product, partial [Mesorhabditis belari]|uniref:Lipoprotein n=1 Tax=Mesorhabditis belari TaxID=2138241 RepID=A0AAF3EEH1_9BILA